ncbi:unnamed protein product [Ectocarpus sp. CCAP 1310/34]|nr:unnamed protein product [Ectocarpus sp. CCAP 1310/34]
MKISARAAVAAATALVTFAATPVSTAASAGFPSTITEAAEDELGDLHHASSEGMSTLRGFESRQEPSHEEDVGNSGSTERIIEQTDGPRPLKHRGFAQHPQKRQRRKRNVQRLNLGVSEQGEVASVGSEIKREEDETRGVTAVDRFPPLEDSTVMFLHVFKCAGSTLRQMFVDWAKAEGASGAIVTSCDEVQKEGVICLAKHELIKESVQMKMLLKQKILAGHFIWGFQRLVEKPFLMVTSLRNPLEAFVSGRQFLHPDMTETLEQASAAHAQAFVSYAMLNALGIDGPGHVAMLGERASLGHALLRGRRQSPDQLGGFIFRLVGQENAKKLHGLALSRAADEAMKNLEAFWVVGVVEQYAGLQAVLKRLLDPDLKHPALWDKYSYRHSNRSPVDSRYVLAAIDPSLVRQFNDSLALQWKVYEKAVELWGTRCREVLPITVHDAMCTVAPPDSRYS